MRRIGIVVALPAEARSLAPQRCSLGAPIALDAQRLLVISGVGPKAAAAAAALLVDEGVNGLVSWGCAAALAPTLRPGDLVLPALLSDLKGHCLEATLAWRQRIHDSLSSLCSCHDGMLIDSVEIVASAHAKKTLHAQSGALALDMESLTLARAAHEHALPFLAVRAIADPAQMNLPGAVLAGMDETGQVHLPRLLAHVLCHPKDLPGLFRLGGYFRAALKTLTLAATHLGPELAC